MSISLLLVGLALVFTMVAAAGRVPVWPAVLLLVLERLLAVA